VGRTGEGVEVAMVVEDMVGGGGGSPGFLVQREVNTSLCRGSDYRGFKTRQFTTV